MVETTLYGPREAKKQKHASIILIRNKIISKWEQQDKIASEEIIRKRDARDLEDLEEFKRKMHARALQFEEEVEEIKRKSIEYFRLLDIEIHSKLSNLDNTMDETDEVHDELEIEVLETLEGNIPLPNLNLTHDDLLDM